MEIIEPTPTTTLRGSIEVFEWDLDGLPVTNTLLYIGSSPGGSQYRAISVGADTIASVQDLPVDGSEVFVRIWYRVNRRWSVVDGVYTAATAKNEPAITSPAPGGLLEGEAAEIAWDLKGLPIESSWIYAGTTPGGSEFSATMTGTDTSTSITGLPADGTDVQVRLYYKAGGTWYYTDHTFTSVAPAPAEPEQVAEPEQLEEEVELPEQVAVVAPVAAEPVAEPVAVVVPDEEELIRELQGLVGTVVDGDVGPNTRAAFNNNWVGYKARFDPSFASRLVNDERVVSWVQRRLNTRGGLQLAVDGDFGATTEAAVISQLGKGGIVASESFQVLLTAG